MAGKIIIKEIPFEEILRSAYETLKEECGGLLFGERLEIKDGLVWIVEYVHPIQLAVRYPNSLGARKGFERSYWSLLRECIGDYHSHITTTKQKGGVMYADFGRVFLGGGDKKNLRENPDKIEVVMGLREASRTGKLGENPFLVKGYIKESGNIYRIDVGGYYYQAGLGFRRALIEVKPKRILKMIR